MKAERRTIIVREIEHWRRSKLLPDHYCDFLLNLYADPVLAPKSKDIGEEPQHLIGKAILTVSKATGKQWFLTIGILTLISFVVLYFSSFHPALQIASIIAGSTLMLWAGEKIRDKYAPISFLSIFLGHLLLLIGGLYLIELHELSSWSWNVAIVSICSIIWLIYGIKSKLGMLQLCGWLALLMVYALLLNQFTAGNMWEIQLYWLPLAILFIWVSWFIHRWFKSVSAILFIVGLITCFLPEIYQFVFVEEVFLLHLQLIIKVIVAAIILFALKKKWMVWVV